MSSTYEPPPPDEELTKISPSHKPTRTSRPEGTFSNKLDAENVVEISNSGMTESYGDESKHGLTVDTAMTVPPLELRQKYVG
jgi:hypothetical protein